MDRKESITEAIAAVEERESITKLVKAAIKEYEKEKNSQRKKSIYANTEILLKHYNEFRQHIEKSISDTDELIDSEYEEENKLTLQHEIDRGESYVSIQSIKRSRMRTLLLVVNIESAMLNLEQIQKDNKEWYKYRALEMKYVKKMSIEQIAKELDCGTATANRWVKTMVTDLGILLFGIDGMRCIL